jgi:hypothetical protein
LTDNRHHGDANFTEVAQKGSIPVGYLGSFDGGVVVSSQNLLIVIFLIAMAVTLIGWRTVLVLTLTAGVTLAVLGLVEIATLLSSAT